MKTSVISLLLILFFMNGNAQENQVKIFGHRGCRGLYPENTIEGFNKAIELGTDGIEWDVIVSKDNELVISHEPYLDGTYCLDANGNEISASEGKKVNFFELTTSEIQEFDCGSKDYPKYPEQKKLKSYKPTVEQAFDKLDLSNVTILFEIKSERPDYGIFQPNPVDYAHLIAQEVADFEYKENIVFMCFDPNLLEALHKILPAYKYVYLTYKPLTSAEKFLKDLSFTPYALGMYHHTIRKRDVKYLHEKQINVFAWTVNKNAHADKMKRYGVDGIITDYPDRIKK